MAKWIGRYEVIVREVRPEECAFIVVDMWDRYTFVLLFLNQVL